MTRVLPVPAPASTSSGPSVARTASRWRSFKPLRKSGVCGEEVKEQFYLSETRSAIWHFEPAHPQPRYAMVFREHERTFRSRSDCVLLARCVARSNDGFIHNAPAERKTDRRCLLGGYAAGRARSGRACAQKRPHDIRAWLWGPGSSYGREDRCRDEFSFGIVHETIYGDGDHAARSRSQAHIRHA